MACADVRSWVTNGLGAATSHFDPRRTCNSDWVVHAKRPFAGPKQALGYLLRYTHTGRQRPAVTNLATIHYVSLVPREWFGKVSKQRINVLSIQRISAGDRAKIEAVDPAIELSDAGGWYDGELCETWPALTTARYLAPGATGPGTREFTRKICGLGNLAEGEELGSNLLRVA